MNKADSSQEERLNKEDSPGGEESMAESATPLSEIYRRVAAGDTSVVSEVYWLQMFPPPAKKK